MAFTYCEASYSDLYKNAYGFRPSFDSEFYSASPERKQVIWDALLEANDREMDEYNRRRKESLERFERLVDATMVDMGYCREDAIAHLVEAVDEYGDRDYAEYRYDLPMGYLSK